MPTMGEDFKIIFKSNIDQVINQAAKSIEAGVSDREFKLRYGIDKSVFEQLHKIKSEASKIELSKKFAGQVTSVQRIIDATLLLRVILLVQLL